MLNRLLFRTSDDYYSSHILSTTKVEVKVTPFDLSNIIVYNIIVL